MFYFLKRACVATLALLFAHGLQLQAAEAELSPVRIRQGLERFLGGQDAWNGVQSMRSEGELYIGEEEPVQVRIFRKRPDQMRALIGIASSDLQMDIGHDGEHTWLHLVEPTADGERRLPQEVDETTQARMHSEAVFGWPVHLAMEDGTLVEAVPEEIADGHPDLISVRIKRPNGFYADIWMSPDTFEPRFARYPDRLGKEPQFQVAMMGDWQMVEGVRFPHRVFIQVSTMQENRFILHKYRVNVGVFDSYFEEPKVEPVEE